MMSEGHRMFKMSYVDRETNEELFLANARLATREGKTNFIVPDKK